MTVRPLSIITKAISQTWREYVLETTIHGIKYSVGRRRLDRWVWTIIPLVSAGGAYVLMLIMYTNYYAEPTRAIYETQFAAMASFPFPGVSICAPRKFTDKNIDMFLNKIKIPPNVTRDALKKMVPVMLGLTTPTNSTGIDLNMLDYVLAVNEYSPQDALKILVPSCRKILVRCRWEGKDLPCTELFRRAKTKDGYCCSFNYNTDFNDRNFKGLTSPYFGPAMGLSVVVDTIGMYNKQVYHLMDSFKLIVHNSQTYVGRFTIDTVMPLFSEISVAFMPLKIKIGPQALILGPVSRKCYTSAEFPLKHFALYSKADCLIECEITKSNGRCGCQPYMYPRNDDDIVCNVTSIPCLEKHFSQVQSVDWEKSCNCPAQCNENSTDITVDTTDLLGVKYNNDPLYNQLTENQTLVHFFYGREFGTIVRKAVVTYWVDLLSSFGGVFSLFLGCSFLSILEAAYYGLVKFPQKVLKLYRHEKKVGVNIFK